MGKLYNKDGTEFNSKGVSPASMQLMAQKGDIYYQNDDGTIRQNPINSSSPSVQPTAQPQNNVSPTAVTPAQPNVTQPATTNVTPQEAYQNWIDSKPADYNGNWTSQMENALNEVLGRGSFSYNPNEDPMYQSIVQNALVNGRRAMQDTMGNAAALTGGYGNSYASSAGQQAYQESLRGINDYLPNLYEMALKSYTAEGDRLTDNLAALRDADQMEYDRYRDNVDDYYKQGDVLYRNYRDTVSDAQDERDYNEKVRQFNESLAEEKRQYNSDIAYKNASLAEEKRQYDSDMNYKYAALAQDAIDSEANMAYKYAALQQDADDAAANLALKYAELSLDRDKLEADIDSAANDYILGLLKQGYTIDKNGDLVYVGGDTGYNIEPDPIASDTTSTAPSVTSTTTPTGNYKDIIVGNNNNGTGLPKRTTDKMDAALRAAVEADIDDKYAAQLKAKAKIGDEALLTYITETLGVKDEQAIEDIFGKYMSNTSKIQKPLNNAVSPKYKMTTLN